jgi:hypothetical protein
MAYDYDLDILDALWDGAEDGEEPYLTFIAENPLLTDEVSENRILSTIEALRSHMELLADRDEARLFHFCIATMLEGFGSGGFIYGATSRNEQAIVEGNVPNAVFAAGDDIEFAVLDGVTGVAPPIVIASDDFSAGLTVQDVVDSINGTGAAAAVGIFAERTQDNRLRIFQTPIGAETAAAGFVITRGEGGANDSIVTKSGIVTQPPGARATEDGLVGGYYLAKVTEVANNCRDRALAVFAGQRRESALT